MRTLFKYIIFSAFLFISNISTAQNGSYTGLGNASVSLYDFWSIFNNQAGLADIESPEIAISYDHNYQIWQTGVQAGGFVLPTKSGNFAIMGSRYGYSGYAEHKTGLSYARNLGKMFSASLTFNYMIYSQSASTEYNGAFFFQAGIISRPIENLQIGLHVYNPGMVTIEDYNNTTVPTIIRFGVAYYFSDEVLCSIETEKDIDQSARFKAGVQYQPVEDFYLRTGFLTNENQFTLGIGYNLNGFTMDISASTHEVLQLTGQISFKYTFD